MNRADRKRWASARTLADLGNLTALWLEGEIAKTPNYDGHPDPETRDLAPVLAACNRAGFVTLSSQPAFADDGDGWEQRAAVDGLASPEVAERLRSSLGAAVNGGGLIFRAWTPPPRTLWRTGLPVTTVAGRNYTRFGVQLSRRHLLGEFDGCSREATNAVIGNQQILIADSRWGRNDLLWPALERFAAREVCPS